MKIILVMLMFLVVIQSMYDENDKVVVLTAENFQTLVLDSEELWMVEFYAPWCGHCKKLVPEFKKAAEEMEGVVNFGALDMTQHGAAVSSYKISGYPTLKFFLKNKQVPPYSYSDQRTAEAMIGFVKQQAGEVVEDGWHKKKYANIIEISKDNFDELVLQSESAWFLELYAPWCKACKEMRNDLAKLAKEVKGQVNVGKLDVTINHPDPVAERVGIDGYPTLIYFHPGAKTDKEGKQYKGDKKFLEMKDFVLRENIRFLEGEEAAMREGDVQLFDHNNWQMFENSKDPWFIEFYAPWCGHCKDLNPKWAKLGTELASKVKVGKIDASTSEFNSFKQKYNVKGYPTIIFFPAGKKDDISYEVYEGAKEVNSMAEWALKKKDTLKPLEVSQLTEEVFDSDCAKNSLCIIAFLPHIYDSTEKERRETLQQIKNLYAETKGKPIKFAWSQGGDQYNFEQLFHLSAGYPAVLAISYRKESFVDRLSKGKEGVSAYKKENVKLVPIEEWEDLGDDDDDDLDIKDEEEKKEQNEDL